MKVLSKLTLFVAIFAFFLLGLSAASAYAIEDPLARPNNKFGIHILFPSELADAAHLLNTSGGDWGYVTIPIQAGDRDLDKWQHFFDDCRKLHLIPIVRLATEGDYFNTAVWRRPTPADMMDFANFLNSLNWPTKNRYVIVFNEVNRGDEWGGATDPADYAQILSYAVTIFKSKSQDFFMIAAGMDNGAPSQGTAYMNEYTYYSQMNFAYPNIFTQIDGIASHSYPNPGFIQSPSSTTNKSIMSFQYEKQQIDAMANKKLPVFITETGWDKDVLGEDKVAEYYKTAFQTVWNDSSVVAVTPFLLRASAGPFEKFSILPATGSDSTLFKTISALPKTLGSPSLTPQVLAAEIADIRPASVKAFPKPTPKPTKFTPGDVLRSTVKWIFKL
jgi:hypothetical protein